MAVQMEVSSSPSEKIFNAFRSNVVIKVSISGIISMNSQSGVLGQNCKYYDPVSARRRRKILSILAHRMT